MEPRVSAHGAIALMELKRAERARQAVPAYYDRQRRRYAEAFDKLGLDL